jgi:polyferredoxin
MECVACTACIDACDEVMAVLGRAPGLVRYTSQNQDQSADSHARPFRIRWRVRPLAYFAVATLLLGTFGTLVNTRPGLQMEVLRMKGPPYLSKAADGGATEVVNLFQISVRNRTGSPISVSVEAAGIEGLRLTGQTRAVELGSGEQRRLAIVATALFPAGTLGPSRPIRIEVRGTGPGNQETRVSQSVPMITPLR